MSADGKPDKVDQENKTGVLPEGNSVQPEGPVSTRAVNFWKHVANMTSVGWSTVLPIAGGVLLGHYLDRRSGSGEYVWTVGLLVGGIMVAFYNLYHILTKELRE